MSNKIFPNTISVFTDEDGNKIDRRRQDARERRPASAYTKVYVWLDEAKTKEAIGDSPAFGASDADWKAYTKKVVALKRELLRDCCIDPDCYRYSRTAGCACGCSPGFINKNGREADGAVEIFVTQGK